MASPVVVVLEAAGSICDVSWGAGDDCGLAINLLLVLSRRDRRVQIGGGDVARGKAEDPRETEEGIQLNIQ